MPNVLDLLLVSLDVQLQAFALLEIRNGRRLVFDGLDQVIVHFVLSGGGWLEVPGQDPVRCDVGSVLVLPAGRKQAFRIGAGRAVNIDAAKHCAMVKDGLIRFDATGGGVPDLRVLCGSIMATNKHSFGLFEQLRAPLTERFEEIEAVPKAFQLLQQEVKSPGLGTRAIAGAIMKFCLVLLIRKHLATLAAQSPLGVALADRRLSRSVAAVLEAPAASHTVAALAATADMSRSVFARAFSTSFNMTPMEFVAKVRLHHAAQLLCNTSLPVKVIASSIGFGSRSHFSRAFRAAYGHGPRAYRRLQGVSPAAAPRTVRVEQDDED
jgi:AraC family transcriptional activator of mtrCDE